MGANLIAAIRPALREVADSTGEKQGWCAEFSIGPDKIVWIQVTSNALNFCYPHDGDPGERMVARGIPLIEGITLQEWAPRKVATLGVGEFDVDKIARFTDALLTRFFGLTEDAPLDTRLYRLE